MINLFRTYNPISIFWLAIVLFVLRVGYLVHVPAQIPLSLVEASTHIMLPYKFVPALSAGSSMLIAGIIVLLQAILINYLINHYNLLGRPSFLPGLMYITVSSLFTPFLLLSAPLLCNFMTIWMLFKLIALYNSENPKGITFDLGMMVAVGALIYLPFTYMLIAVMAALVIFRPFDWRDWAAALIGYCTVYFFVAVYYYLHDRLGAFPNIWLPLISPFVKIAVFEHRNYLLLIPVAVILVLGLFKLQENFFKSYVLIRKSFNLLNVIFLLAGVSYYVHPAVGLSHFLLCVVTLAIFFAYYFLYATKRWFYETLYFVLLAGIIYFQFNTF